MSSRRSPTSAVSPAPGADQWPAIGANLTDRPTSPRLADGRPAYVYGPNSPCAGAWAASMTPQPDPTDRGTIRRLEATSPIHMQEDKRSRSLDPDGGAALVASAGTFTAINSPSEHALHPPAPHGLAPTALHAPPAPVARPPIPSVLPHLPREPGVPGVKYESVPVEQEVRAVL